ncbi:MAG: ankyrin repeat domain-containing protein [Fimbriimonadaceae bacterium]|nr:ankyrin repeat domain-containing protein [Fimbriimonadaceae bacterium]
MPATTDAVFAAAAAGDRPALIALLEADAGLLCARRVGADGPRGSSRKTLLQVAAEAGHLELVQALVDRGAELTERAEWGYPAVMHAAWAKQQAVVDWFLGAGAAHDHGQGDPFYGLGVDLNNAGRMGWTAIVRRHVERDPLAVHRRGLIGDSPLHWPAHDNHTDIVTLLLDAGAVIEADEVGLYGGKPLHWAAEHAPATTRLLLERGADPNSRNEMPGEMLGITPLIMCARQRNDCAECAELLLAAGADPAARGADGRTALDCATAAGLPRLTALLSR